MTAETVETPWWVGRPYLDFAARSAHAAYELLMADHATWNSRFDGRCDVEHEEPCDWIDIGLEFFAILAPHHAHQNVLSLDALEYAVANPRDESFLVSSLDWPFRLVEVDDLALGSEEEPAPGIALVLTLCVPALAEIEASPKGPRRRDRRGERRDRRDAHLDRLEQERDAALALCTTKAERSEVRERFLSRIAGRSTEPDLRAAGWVMMSDWPAAKPFDRDQLSLW